jgi:hypothetical protein
VAGVVLQGSLLDSEAHQVRVRVGGLIEIEGKTRHNLTASYHGDGEGVGRPAEMHSIGIREIG